MKNNVLINWLNSMKDTLSAMDHCDEEVNLTLGAVIVSIDEAIVSIETSDDMCEYREEACQFYKEILIEQEALNEVMNKL